MTWREDGPLIVPLALSIVALAAWAVWGFRP